MRTEYPSSEKFGGWLSPLVHLSNNWISLLGVVIVTTATIFWLFLLPTTLRGEVRNPYIGILAFLALAGAFFAGLALIPVGIWLRRKREQKAGLYPASFPPLNLRNRGVPPPGDLYRSDHLRQPGDRQPVDLWRRYLHGNPEFLRPDLPHRDAARVYGVSELPALQGGVRAMPHRARSFLVRQKQTLRRGAGIRGHLQYLSAAHPHPGAQPAPRAGNLRDVPLAPEVRRGSRACDFQVRRRREEYRSPRPFCW